MEAVPADDVHMKLVIILIASGLLLVCRRVKRHFKRRRHVVVLDHHDNREDNFDEELRTMSQVTLRTESEYEQDQEPETWGAFFLGTLVDVASYLAAILSAVYVAAFSVVLVAAPTVAVAGMYVVTSALVAAFLAVGIFITAAWKVRKAQSAVPENQIPGADAPGSIDHNFSVSSISGSHEEFEAVLLSLNVNTEENSLFRTSLGFIAIFIVRCPNIIVVAMATIAYFSIIAVLVAIVAMNAGKVLTRLRLLRLGCDRNSTQLQSVREMNSRLGVGIACVVAIATVVGASFPKTVVASSVIVSTLFLSIGRRETDHETLKTHEHRVNGGTHVTKGLELTRPIILVVDKQNIHIEGNISSFVNIHNMESSTLNFDRDVSK